MRFPSFVFAALLGTACTGATNVDDLFDPTSGSGSGGQTTGSGGSGGSSGGTGGSTGGTGGSTGGTGGAGTGGVGTGGAGTGGTGGSTAGSGGTGGTAGVADSGLDVRRDVTPDVVDAGKGGIKCGTATCDPATSFCCLQTANTRCVNTGGTCAAMSDRLHCDDTADCAAGTICCAANGALGAGADSTCVASATCITPRQMMCDSTKAGPCMGSVIVAAVCSANASGVFTDYPYCHVAP